MPVVFVGLGLARLAILTLPFARYSQWLGPQGSQIGAVSPDPVDQDKVARVGRLVSAVARITPWTSNCLPQALVAAWVLRRMHVPHAVHLGVKRADKESDPGLEAHAWVLSGSVPVTGVAEAVGMTPVASFVST